MKHLILFIAVMAMAISSFGQNAQSSEVPTEVLKLVSEADSVIAIGEWSKADSLLVEAINLRPNDPGNVLLLSNLGIVRFQKGDEKSALETLNEAHRIAPISVTVLSNRARVFLGMNKKDEAIADYERIMELDSTMTEPYFYRGMVSFSRGDIPAAEADFSKLQKLAPDEETTLLAMATIQTAQGKNLEARDNYRKLIEISPAAEYYSGLIENLLALDDLTEASNEIAAAISKYPVDPEFYIMRAVLNKRLYRLDDARNDARKAVSLGADKEQVNLILNSR